MNIHELESELQKIKVPRNCYSIMKGGLPNEVYCLTAEGGNWIVYYSERGSRTGLTSFKSEADACNYFYNKIKNLWKEVIDFIRVYNAPTSGHSFFTCPHCREILKDLNILSM